LLVHGHASNRAEGMRPLPTLAGLGLPVLDMTYRNDSGAPSSSDHLYHLGATEWQDVQAGVRYALAHGARNIVLYGYSMGGNLVESFLHHSAYAGRVRAVVLDAPALNWSAVLDWHATHSSLPGLFKDVEMPLIKQIAAWRMGMWNLDPLNQVRLAGELKAPTLLFHGTSDTNVPITTSAAFARARPDLVTFVPVAGAEHTSSWNVAPTMYTAKLKAFLTRTLR
ncbi:MAG TPA: prolyl oligopeptidase family serine peptidase, partial [Chloroflexota bacterium]